MEQPIVIALISASIALGGVAVAQATAMFQSWLERKHKKAILLRTKYEELAEHLNDSLAWAMDCMRAITFTELNARAQPLAARKAYTLCLLYFPLLKNHANRYVQASVAFSNTLVESFEPTTGLDAGGQASKNLGTKFEAACEALRAAREALDMEIQRCANVYISA